MFLVRVWQVTTAASPNPLERRSVCHPPRPTPPRRVTAKLYPAQRRPGLSARGFSPAGSRNHASINQLGRTAEPHDADEPEPFTRRTNAFSKKWENHEYAVAIYTMHYNFFRVHQTLRVTPAMAAGLTDHVWELEELVGLIG